MEFIGDPQEEKLRTMQEFLRFWAWSQKETESGRQKQSKRRLARPYARQAYPDDTNGETTHRSQSRQDHERPGALAGALP